MGSSESDAAKVHCHEFIGVLSTPVDFFFFGCCALSSTCPPASKRAPLLNVIARVLPIGIDIVAYAHACESIRRQDISTRILMGNFGGGAVEHGLASAA